MSDQIGGIYTSFGYGVLPRSVMRDRNLPAQSKAIYAYLVSFAGSSKKAWPSVSLMTAELGMGRDTFYKYMNILKVAGYVQVERQREFGRWLNNVYRINDAPCPDLPDKVKPDKEKPSKEEPDKDNQATNNNIPNNNNLNKKHTDNNNRIAYEEIKDLFNSICISFAQVRLMSERRKETVRARVKQYGGVEVFQELFEKAEASDFLKGKNNRGWKADFDWLIKEANMAKVLEDRYINPEEKKNDAVPDLGTFQTETVLPY